MTAMNYTELTSDDIGDDKILRAATLSALDTNPTAIAQRGTDAPWLNGIGAIEAKTSGTGTFTVPAGVYRMKVTCVGGGGGVNYGNGNDTTFGTLTAGGGAGGANTGSMLGGAGGSASGGDINVPGRVGPDINSLGAAYSAMGVIGCGSYADDGGAGHGTTCGGGGSAGMVIKIFHCEPGDVFPYSVGSAGSGGGNGIIIIEY